MELIRDISNELDINVLCHKILVNVCLLTHADRGSLFLAKGTTKNRYLIAKLFDVTQDTGKSLNRMHKLNFICDWQKFKIDYNNNNHNINLNGTLFFSRSFG